MYILSIVSDQFNDLLCFKSPHAGILNDKGYLFNPIIFNLNLNLISQSMEPFVLHKVYWIIAI